VTAVLDEISCHVMKSDMEAIVADTINPCFLMPLSHPFHRWFINTRGLPF